MLDMLKFLKSRDVLCKLVTMNLALVSNAFLCPAEAMRTATATTNINNEHQQRKATGMSSLMTVGIPQRG